MAILKSDKIDYKQKTNKRQRRLYYNERGVSPTKGYSIYKYLCTQIGVYKYTK